MKRHIIYLVASLLGIMSSASCSPQHDEVVDTNLNSNLVIDSVVLKPSNDFLLASADNQVDLFPVCYYTVLGEKQILPMENVQDSWFEWTDESGNIVSRYYSTTDKGLIGKQKKFKVRLKEGKKIVSNEAVIAIVGTESFPEVIIPVVFHLIQSTNEVVNYGVNYDYEIFRQQLDKLNNVFANKVVKTATGVDTHIKFVPAVYNPIGKKMSEPGLHRVVYDFTFKLNEEAAEPYTQKQVYEIINNGNAVWDYNKYFNVWLISEFADKITDFGPKMVEWQTFPELIAEGGDMDNPPAGIYPSSPESDSSIELRHIGLMYRMQDLLAAQSASNETNELVYYVGHFYGLMPTKEDELDLTIKYVAGDSKYYLSNNTEIKETATNFFRSTNIMDDRHGLHTAISQDQAQTLHWVLNNMLGRQAWKSKFALIESE